MNKKVLAAITGLVLAVCFSSGAQEGARPIYADWPDTDPEWNALTNHITWCWNSLHERCLAVSRHFDVDHYINEYSGPVLVCPYQDYCAMIEIIDEVAPLFVRQDMAGEDGDFAGYFAAKDSENIFHDKFPRWTPESLRMAAFGRSSWSTNTVLTAWMAITNRAFIGEVESAIKLLRWTEETEWSIPQAASNQKYSHSYYGSSNTFQNALADFSGVLNAYSSGGFEFAYSVINGHSESGSDYDYYLEADNDYGYGADFDFWSLLAPACYVLTNTIVKHRPSVSVFFRRVIENEGYLFPEVSDRKLMYFGETLGFPREHEVLTTYENPFVSIAGGDPLTYAGLRDQAYEFAWYGEQGHLHWLLKWGFEDGSPEIPGFSPIQMRDTDGDDVTEIDGLERAVGGETGTFLVSHRDESPWMYLPLAEPAPWNSHVPVYAYLSAGVITNLPYHYMPQNEISYIIDWSCYEHDGYLSAYSLNTRIQEIKCISNEVSHVKQVLVIRPRGQAVIFDFPWHDQYGFSPFGYPVGTNSNLGYVLADMSDNDDCDWWPESYKLLFPSGISHYFDGYDRGCSLLYVQNEEGFVNWIEPALCALHGLTHPPPFNYFSFDYFPPTVTNSRHAVAIGWLGGRAVSATYCSAVSGEECERTDVVYDEQGRPIKLVKRDPLSGAELNGNCAVSYCSGFTCERKRAESGQDGCFSARIDTIAHGEVAPVVSHFKTFDSTQCLISEKLLSAGLLPFEIKYSYPEESYPDEVYPASGFRVRNSPSSIVRSTALGEVAEYRGYTADEGWIQCLGRDLGDGLILVEEYVYGATNSGLPLVAINRLAEVTKKINDVLIRKNIVIATNLLPNQSFHLRMKTCSSPASDYNDPTNLDDGFYCYNDASGDYWGPAYSVRTSQVLSYPANGGSDSCATERRLSAYDYRKSLQSTAITTASGVDRYLKIQAFEGAVLEETVTEVDGKGRPVTSSFMDGTSVAFQDWCLHGPQKIINRDGSETALAYDPFGRVKRSVDGESGIVFEYEYDPMGRVTRQTRSAGGQQLESRWTYGLDGTLLYAKDESGHEVSFSGRYVNGLLELTRSETGLGDVVETFWADGRLKSVSGDGAAVRFSCERGITDNRLWIKKINPEKPGEWVKTWYAFNGSFDATERPGGVFDRVSFDSSLMPESSVSGDGVRRLFSHDHRHSSLPVFSGVALGGAIPWIWLAIPAASATHTLSRPEGCSPRCFRFRRTAAANRLNPIPPACRRTVFPVPLQPKGTREIGSATRRHPPGHSRKLSICRTAPSRRMFSGNSSCGSLSGAMPIPCASRPSLTGTTVSGHWPPARRTRAVSRKRSLSAVTPPGA